MTKLVKNNSILFNRNIFFIEGDNIKIEIRNYKYLKLLINKIRKKERYFKCL